MGTNLIKNSGTIFLKNHKKILHTKFHTISTNNVASEFCLINFLNIFLKKIDFLESRFCLSIFGKIII